MRVKFNLPPVNRELSQRFVKECTSLNFGSDFIGAQIHIIFSNFTILIIGLTYSGDRFERFKFLLVVWTEPSAMQEVVPAFD